VLIGISIWGPQNTDFRTCLQDFIIWLHQYYQLISEEKKPILIEFPAYGDSTLGYITHAEFPKNLPFEVKRVYWTYYTPHDVERGNHSHKELEQIIFALNGSIKFILEGLDGKQEVFVLDKPSVGLYIPPGYWRTIHFSHNGVMLCLASMEFDEADYVRSYEDFHRLNPKNK
jgi:hypothetical protein